MSVDNAVWLSGKNHDGLRCWATCWEMESGVCDGGGGGAGLEAGVAGAGAGTGVGIAGGI